MPGQDPLGSLFSGLLGIKPTTKTKSHTTATSNATIHPRMRQIFDILSRYLTGQLVKPPETAISVPQQQSISLLQGMAPSFANTGQGMAQRLAGGGVPANPLASQSFLPDASAPGGVPTPSTSAQAGLQTREQLGLPPRSSYVPEGFVPSAEDVAKIGLPPVRAGTKRIQKLSDREAKLQSRIEQRTTAGKSTTGAEKKLGNVQRKLAAKKGKLY